MNTNRRITTMLLISILLLVAATACNLPGILQTATPKDPVAEAMKTIQAQSTQAFLSTAIAQMTSVAKNGATPLAPQGTSDQSTQEAGMVTATPAPAQSTSAPAVITVVVTPTKSATVPTVAVNPVKVTPIPVPCYRADFIADVTVPDGTRYAPGEAFTKIWRLKNSGTCTWKTTFDIAFDSGDQMGAPQYGDLQQEIAPGKSVDIAIPMIAPNTAGEHVGKWMLVNENGVRFGAGEDGKKPFWVAINVTGSASGKSFDFVGRAAEASWSTGAGALSFPSKEDYAKGFVTARNNFIREDGGTEDETGLFMVPNNSGSIYNMGIYPAYTVKSGDVFQSTIMCAGGAENCDVDMGLNYRIGNGPVTNINVWDQKYDKQMNVVQADLSFLAGQTVQFILVTRNGSSTSDMVPVWLGPAIYKK